TAPLHNRRPSPVQSQINSSHHLDQPPWTAHLEAVQNAFEQTRGDFRAKFTAAVEARLAQIALPEVFIEVPEHPEQLSKGDLDALVRPAADGFLRSHPTKAELVEQAVRIRRRQKHRPAWIPRIDLSGETIVPAARVAAEDEREPDRPLLVTALAEPGEITVALPAAGDERPELAMAPGGVGEWESALYVVLGLVGADCAARTITLDAAANEALVPDENRWWSTAPSPSVSAAEDPGVASELLATCKTLGGLLVVDGTSPEVLDAVAFALQSAGNWRYGPRWQMEPSNPSGDVTALTTARAAVAGWASPKRSGLIVFVYGGVLYADEGLVGFPAPLHSYLLVVSRSADGTDSPETVHRVNLSCPGEHWCHRNGCPDTGFPEFDTPLTLIITGGHAAQAASASTDEFWRRSYQDLYGDENTLNETEQVLDKLVAVLGRSGWVELSDSTWDGGLEERLLRRGEHCITAAYDLVTRQIQLSDGRAELESTLQILAEEGILIEDNGREKLEMNEAAFENWGADVMTAADEFLSGRIKEFSHLVTPMQITLLGLHPHGDGSLRAPEAVSLAERQLGRFFEVAGVLSGNDDDSA
ncbi:hypothetical protein ACGFJ7_46765, partial [Actinoplanes sp. NPDC048988]|uniref:hypothetical protein n=1 Tax=Actinoplanes sp. NPDC048988 TaxID=3363901 RepID=UPI00371315B7